MWRLAVALGLAATVGLRAADKTLDIYFVDVEGGQSTLIVTPAGQALLVDAGYAGQPAADGSTRNRDVDRILAATRDAGVTRIDILVATHFHSDHVGGVAALAQQIPIGLFVDHGRPDAAADENVPGTLAAFDAYAAARAKGRHLEATPGMRLPLKGVEGVVVSSGGRTLTAPLAGAGRQNASCARTERPAQEPHENPKSVGFRLRFGRFRFLDIGDLTGTPLFALACPTDLIGPVDAYLVAHHGGADAADAATFAAWAPRIAVLNNGARKGGSADVLGLLHRTPQVEDVWQLHRSSNPGAENFGDEVIANLDETTAHWIKLSAREDGSFQIANGRTGRVKTYEVRSP